jgi:hypothetical protein
MMCPNCAREHDPGVAVCPDCDVLLVDAADQPGPGDARLGSFHPAVAERVAELLDRRGLAHTVIARDDATEVRVGADRRDELRTELALEWNTVVGVLDDEVRAALRAARTGNAPGWYDAPRGGHIDRGGKLVVDAGDDEVRTIGPALLTVGAILAIVGWFVLDSGAVTVAGGATALIGLLLPR